MSIVIDASVTIAALSPDERTEATERYFDIISADDVVVPAIWPLEIMHVFRRKVARGTIQPETAADALAIAQFLPVRVSAVTAPVAFTDVGRLARIHGLSPYDASYLDCALRLERPLASLDRRMRAAALAEGIVVIPD
jgi:predicted nucleic acid-binding protein